DRAEARATMEFQRADLAGLASGGGGAPTGAMRAMAAPAPPPARKMKKAERSRGGPPAEMDYDLETLDAAPSPVYRAADKRQEWAEHNWWHRTPGQSTPEMNGPSRLWRDLAQHRGGPFLSPALGLATGSFAEAMCALAVTDVPFVAGAHAIVPDQQRLTITA